MVRGVFDFLRLSWERCLVNCSHGDGVFCICSNGNGVFSFVPLATVSFTSIPMVTSNNPLCSTDPVRLSTEEIPESLDDEDFDDDMSDVAMATPQERHNIPSTSSGARIRATDPRPCPKCGKIYRSAHTLRTHLEDKHTSCPGYRCVLCGTVAKVIEVSQFLVSMATKKFLKNLSSRGTRSTPTCPGSTGGFRRKTCRSSRCRPPSTPSSRPGC